MSVCTQRSSNATVMTFSEHTNTIMTFSYTQVQYSKYSWGLTHLMWSHLIGWATCFQVFSLNQTLKQKHNQWIWKTKTYPPNTQEKKKKKKKTSNKPIKAQCPCTATENPGNAPPVQLTPTTNWQRRQLSACSMLLHLNRWCCMHLPTWSHFQSSCQWSKVYCILSDHDRALEHLTAAPPHSHLYKR